MVQRGKAKLVDGFTTLRATQRHGVEKRYASTPPAEDTEQDAKKKPGAPKTAMSIGRTVMPTQNKIVCYSCAFEFIMRGKADSTQCPKCGARLGLKDETITGAFSDELITAGKVRLTKSAILDGGKIIANNIVMEGTFKSGSLKAYQTLELGAGAVLPQDALDAKSLRVAEGASFDFNGERTFQDVEVLGELKATFKATGIVTVRATGHLLGRIETQHFIVEEGAGLNADVVIEPEPTAEEEDAELRKTA